MDMQHTRAENLHSGLSRDLEVLYELSSNLERVKRVWSYNLYLRKKILDKVSSDKRLELRFVSKEAMKDFALSFRQILELEEKFIEDMKNKVKEYNLALENIRDRRKEIAELDTKELENYYLSKIVSVAAKPEQKRNQLEIKLFKRARAYANQIPERETILSSIKELISDVARFLKISDRYLKRSMRRIKKELREIERIEKEVLKHEEQSEAKDALSSKLFRNRFRNAEDDLINFIDEISENRKILKFRKVMSKFNRHVSFPIFLSTVGATTLLTLVQSSNLGDMDKVEGRLISVTILAIGLAIDHVRENFDSDSIKNKEKEVSQLTDKDLKFLSRVRKNIAA